MAIASGFVHLPALSGVVRAFEERLWMMRAQRPQNGGAAS
jgi:hypothetical protein